MTTATLYGNTILRALDAATIERLQLKPITFEPEHRIEFPGDAIEHLYFVESGMASMTTTFMDGTQVEVGMFGYESVIGVSGLMGTKRSLNRVYTQIPGYGYASPLAAARQEFQRGGVFQLLALRYVQAQLVLVMQSAGCNVKHNFEQRLARWLLLCADRAHSDTFRMTHEYLAQMLGATRSTVSVAAAHAQDESLIEYTRGFMRILDPVGLQARSCECYAIIKNHLDNYAEVDSSHTGAGRVD
jgi:CRP-like cAMP-binding protein